MKIKTRTISAGLIIIFVIAFVILYMGYLNQVSAKKLADQNLVSAQTLFNKSTTDKNNAAKDLSKANDQLNQMQGQLSQIKQDMAAKRSAIPASLDGINYTDIIFDTAKNANVRIQNPIQSLSQGDIATKNISAINFTTQSFSFSVKADNLTDVVNFIHSLANEESFKNASIDTVNIGVVNDSITTKNADGSQTQTTRTRQLVNVTITMYAYSG